MSSPALGAAIVGQLLAQGVTDFVLAPGSRSTPVALALADVAERDGVRVHVRIDERSAGFLALGLARGSGRPVAVCTTSGTAVGNLLPAVMEAHHSHVPLVVVSADRPATLVGTGANQTTVQAGIFGAFVRDAVRLSGADDPQAWRALVARAEIAAAGRVSAAPGPVHINAEFAEPLLNPEAGPVLGDFRRVEATPAAVPAAIELDPAPRTVVVAGDASVETGLEALALATVADLPLIAEPSSNARRPGALATGRLLLDSGLGRDVQRVVVFGHPTLSRPVTRLLARADVEVVAVTRHPTWSDPTWNVRRVAGSVTLDAGAPDWAARWRAADARIAARIVTDAADIPTGRALAATVLASLGADDCLVVGPSAIVRDLDLAPISTDPPRVVANRGLAGIDGVISTAAGVALGTGRPTHLLCGDLTFLHDSNGLFPGHGPRPDLRVVVADDDGGSIFSTLEPGALPQPVFERYFATPQGLDLVAVAAASGVAARRVSIAELPAVLAAPPAGIEVVVVPVDRAGARDRSRALAELNADSD